MRNKKRIASLAVVLFITVVAVITAVLKPEPINKTGYSPDNVYNHIKELSSEKYKGRKYGTAENMMAVKYIEEQFKTIGLNPAGDDNTYLRNYQEYTKVYSGVGELEVLDTSGKVVKKYKYGEDFVEQSYGYTVSGDIISGFNFLNFNKDSSYEKTKADKSIAIVAVSGEGKPDLVKLSSQLRRADYEALLRIVKDDFDLRRETGSIGDRRYSTSGYEIPTLLIKERVSNELKKFKEEGFKIHAKTTFDIALKPVADVMGMIPGKGKEYLIITAHLDHVGPQSDGTLYPGALDNASGIGTMLEIARLLKNEGKEPAKNILFIAFNGEEGGLLGSKNYVTEPPYPLQKATVINLDMVGAAKDVPLSMMYATLPNNSINSDPSSKLRYYLKKAYKETGITVNEIVDTASDHAYFNAIGVPAVTLIDYDTAKVHTPQDDMNNISRQNIDRAMKLMMEYIDFDAFSYYGRINYKMLFVEITGIVSALYPVIALIVLLLILLYFDVYKEKKGKEKRLIMFPVYAILLLILTLSIISYFPYYYSYAPVQSQKAFNLMASGLMSMAKSLILSPLLVGFLTPGILIMIMAGRRVKGQHYKGNAERDYQIFYALALLTVIGASYTISDMYNHPLYLAFTPDFAQELYGRLVMYGIMALAAYFISSVAYREFNIKKSSAKILIIFSVALYFLITSFYMPISFNKYVRNIKSMGVNAAGTYSGGR